MTPTRKRAIGIGGLMFAVAASAVLASIPASAATSGAGTSITIPFTGVKPMTMIADGTQLYVAGNTSSTSSSGGSLTVVDLTTNTAGTPITGVPVAPWDPTAPGRMVVTNKVQLAKAPGSSDVYVLNQDDGAGGDATLSRVQTSTGTVTTLTAGQTGAPLANYPTVMGLAVDANYVYALGNGNVGEVGVVRLPLSLNGTPEYLRIPGTFPGVGNSPWWIGLSGDTLYVNTGGYFYSVSDVDGTTMGTVSGALTDVANNKFGMSPNGFNFAINGPAIYSNGATSNSGPFGIVRVDPVTATTFPAPAYATQLGVSRTDFIRVAVSPNGANVYQAQYSSTDSQSHAVNVYDTAGTTMSYIERVDAPTTKEISSIAATNSAFYIAVPDDNAIYATPYTTPAGGGGDAGGGTGGDTTGGGTSGGSSAVSAAPAPTPSVTPPPRIRPSAPQDVAITYRVTPVKVGAKERPKPPTIVASVKWKASANTGTKPIPLYEAQLSGASKACQVAPTTNLQCDFPVTRVGTYTATVTAQSEDGTSDGAYSLPTVIGSPSTPANLTVRPADGAIQVSWDPSEANGSPVTEYVVANAAQIKGVPDIGCTTKGKTSCTITGLENGRYYRVAVKAVNAVGASRASGAKGTYPGTVPGKPSTLDGFWTDKTGGKATFTWQVTNGGGGAGIEYGEYRTVVKYGLKSEKGPWIRVPAKDFDKTNGSFTAAVDLNGKWTGLTFYARAVNEVGPGADGKLVLK